MPALDRTQLEQLTALIDEREGFLRADLQREGARLGEESYLDIAGPNADSGDSAFADVAIDTENALMGHTLAELRQLAAARTRLEDGSYGTCTDCGGAIAYARLAAYPTVERCTACQTKHERGPAGSRPPTL
jgi:DnaK suppressor protein